MFYDLLLALLTAFRFFTSAYLLLIRNQPQKMASRDDNSLPNLLYALSVVFAVFPTIVVALRFQVKTKSNPRIFWDDWMIVFALLSCIIDAVFIIIGVATGGLGRPLKRDAVGDPIYDDEFFMFQRVSYVTNAVQMMALGPTKIAVLLLYRRIFGVDQQGFKLVSNILMVLVAVWTVSFFFVNIFTYTPISDMWTKPPGKAHATYEHATDMYNAQCFADMSLDVIIITLPLQQIWKLQMSLRLKLQISSIFLLGLITIGASVARAVIMYGVAAEFDTGNPDQTYYLVPSMYWALIEMSVGIIAASLPLLRPIGKIYSVRHFMLLSTKALSFMFTSSSRTSGRSTHADSNNRDVERIPNSGREDPSKNDKWLRPYDISCLEETIDNETRIESNPMSRLNEGAASHAINFERGYEVVHAFKGNSAM
ncbi:hypothetical protein F4677DRAFT_427807 [Hypoxylon crocopeplum]|nr:hypothetical protein F4677DRAFT_427807 [Hypoxylon crocopeplum]